LKIFKELNKRNFKYVLWKNFHEIDDFFLGKKDLDLFLNHKYRVSFEAMLKEFIVFNAEYYHSSYFDIEHYFLFCENSSRFYHLHVYYKLITGNTWLKEYELLIQSSELEKNIQFIRGIRCVSTELGRSIFNARARMKANGLFNQLVSSRDAHENTLEKTFLGVANESIPRTLDSVRRIKPPILPLVFAVKIFRKIISVVFLSNKRRLKNKGIIIAIGGPDGAGKSTISKMIHDDLSSIVLSSRLSPGRLTQNKVKKQKIKNKKQTKTGALRMIVAGMIRLYLCYWAVFLRFLNVVVVSDRWPGQAFGANDSPTIDPTVSKFLHVLAFFERLLYRAMPKCDLYIDLDVPLTVLQNRNNERNKVGKETAKEIETRAMLYKSFCPKAARIMKLNGNVEKETLRNRCLWEISKAVNQSA
jgi:thymidylate kinase